jgi:hypothetical protein
MPSDEDVSTRAGSLWVMTGLTDQEFQALLPPFEHAFEAYLRDRTIDGQPHTSRRYSTYDHCPSPTIADKRLFMLTYVTQNPESKKCKDSSLGCPNRMRTHGFISSMPC